MSCIRVAHVPVPRRPTPAGAEDTSSRDSLVIVIRCAQRRPERQPRLHPRANRTPKTPHRSLNEGRSVNPGYTRAINEPPMRPVRSTKAGASTPATLLRGHDSAGLHHERSTKAGASTPATPGDYTQQALSAIAQRRPERQPRLHLATRRARGLVRGRSTKAGASTPATLARCRVARCLRETLNEGRSVNPGYTLGWRCGRGRSCPSLNEGRSVNPGYTRALRPSARPASPLNEGRSVNPGYTRPQPSRLAAPQASLNEGRSVNPGYTRPLRPQPEGSAALNEGRSVNPGYTRPSILIRVLLIKRSTKAGASTPATRFRRGCFDTCQATLNEGQSVNPGYTAKFCKRAVSGQTIARPRVREPRQRRVCVHFTRFRTIPRQNGQDQAVETALTAARHTRFPRITEGSQISQSTQGWPSS